MGQHIISYETAQPATPASGFGDFYAKNDGHLYWLRADGTQIQLDSGSQINIVVITWAATITVNMASQPNNTIFRCTLAGATTINISGASDGQIARIELMQDATGGRSVTLSSSFAFGTDITGYTATATASKTDYLGVNFDSNSGKYRVIALARGY